MGNSKQKKPFRKDKNDFFSQLQIKKDMGTTIASVDEYAAAHISYPFLLQNKRALEDEFKHTFAVLKKKKDENHDAFWLYCYYCATLLEAFHKAYEQQAQVAEYQEIKIKIKNHLLKLKEEGEAEEDFIASLEASFINGFYNFITAFRHSSRTRDYVAYSNLCRVYWTFCRLTLVTSFTALKNTEFLAKLDAVLGTHTNVDQIISFLQAPNPVLNYFSVGLFLGRFLIDAAMLVKHTFFPTEEEEREEPSAYERFKFEFYKRHCNFANDLVWATVNFLTNFNHITHIPDPTAGVLTAVFLGFDVCLTLYKCYLAKQEYLTKKAQYVREMDDYANHPERFPNMTTEDRLVHIDMLNNQLVELEIDWRTKEATFHFVAAAAGIFMLGFTATLLFSPPGIVAVCFFACLVATAMYLSAGSYSKYREKGLRLEQAELTGKDFDFALKEYEAARNDFIFTMIKNTVMPALLIATFAICWPAAVLLTVMYMGYELYHAYTQHESKKEAAQLALEEQQVDEVKEYLSNEIDKKYVEEEELDCCLAF